MIKYTIIGESTPNGHLNNDGEVKETFDKTEADTIFEEFKDKYPITVMTWGDINNEATTLTRNEKRLLKKKNKRYLDRGTGDVKTEI